MKKLITLTLVAVMVISMACANVFTLSAVTPTNFWTNVTTTDGKTVKDTIDGEEVFVYSASPFHRSSSPAFDLRPALLAALGDEDEVEVTITFKLKAKFTAGNEGFKRSSCFVIMRGYGYTGPNLADTNAWTDEYDAALNGAKNVFYNDGYGNILANFVGVERLPVVDTVWQTFAVDVCFNRNQLTCDTVPGWSLCINSLGHVGNNPASHYAIYEALMFKDFGVYFVEEYDLSFATVRPTPISKPTATSTFKATAKPTFKPTTTPTSKPTTTPTSKPTTTPTSKPTTAPISKPTATPNNDEPASNNTPTVTATAKPTDNATNAPTATDKIDDSKGADNIGLIIGIAVAAVIVVGAIIAVVIILNKKKATAKTGDKAAE